MTMTSIALNDLNLSNELDSKALAGVSGGQRTTTYNYSVISNRFRRGTKKLVGFVWTRRGLKRKYSWAQVSGYTKTNYKGGYQIV